MAVLYSHVIHGLRKDENEPEPTYSDEEIRTLITEVTTDVLSDADHSDAPGNRHSARSQFVSAFPLLRQRVLHAL